jgi:isopentenyl phosphate kinase
MTQTHPLSPSQAPQLPASPAPLVFLKLGGSLITDKHQPHTTRPTVLARLMREIAAARAARPDLALVLGHGSGSFGHAEGTTYGTREGVHTAEEWQGFAKVQAAAGLLNHLVMEAARAAGLPVVNFPPSASAICRDGALAVLAVAPIQNALAHGLVPVVFGDVAMDETRGGTIVSTEDVFRFLGPRLEPSRLLLAGIEPGVRTRWPDGDILEVVTPDTPLGGIAGSHAADVTGGMASKVQEMLALVKCMPALEVKIFSGVEPGRVQAALEGGAVPGTRVVSG